MTYHEQLLVHLLKANNLVIGDIFSSDPYLSLQLVNNKTGHKSNVKYSTVKNSTLNPVWDEPFLWSLNEFNPLDDVSLVLNMFDKDMFKSDSLGDKTVQLGELELKRNQTRHIELMLENVTKGSVVLDITWLSTKSSKVSTASILFQDMELEVKEKLELIPSMGSIPDWLSGTLFRQVPGRFKLGNTKLQHWFDGPPLVHAFYIQDSKVLFQCRYLDIAYLTEALSAGELTKTAFGTKPGQQYRTNTSDGDDKLFRDSYDNHSDYEKASSKMSSIATMAVIPNVNFDVAGEKYIAVTDSVFGTQFDPETLETIAEQFQWNDNISTKADFTACSHKQKDPVTGISYNVILRLELTGFHSTNLE